jgi:hypothetical protein
MTVSSLTPETLNLVASRVEASHSAEQFVYRESELDEVWRLADITLADAQARGKADHRPEIERLGTLAELVHVAHDLIGQKEDTHGAGLALRKAAALAADLWDGC